MERGRGPRVARWLAALLATLPLGAAAHDSGAVYLRLSADGPRLRGEVDLVVADALALLGLPLDLPEAEAWRVFEARRGELAEALAQGVAIEDDGVACPLEVPADALRRPDEPGLVRLRFEARCAAPITRPAIRYTLLLDLDPRHRAFVAFEAGGSLRSATADAAAPRVEFDLRPASALTHFRVYLREGVHHVATGSDHLLFLAALLLPAALMRVGREWRPQPSTRRVLVEVAGVVSAFTLAHSLTLCLAALDLARPPGRVVESAIAFSVLVAALNNLGLARGVRPWRLAFGFGLVHGFGFAAQLGILGLPPTAKGAALLGFNLGVELGQLAAASLALPLLLALRARHFYRLAVLELPSLAIAWLAAVWCVERAFDVRLLGWG